MVEIKNGGRIDFSFIPSLECNLECPFCMYDAGPNNKMKLDFDKTVEFAKGIDWRIINSCGIYGGEPSIDLPFYQKFVDLIPPNIKRFIISNGAWSTNYEKTSHFIDFLCRNHFYLVVSGTPYHKKFQNVEFLQNLRDEYPNAMRLKGDDVIHPMGRAAVENWTCKKKCLKFHGPFRLGLFPDGSILFQNCDGVYQVVQTYNEPFYRIEKRVRELIRKCSGGR